MFVSTVGASASDVAVGKELASFLVVVLLAFPLNKHPLIVERAEKVGSHAVVHGRSGA